MYLYTLSRNMMNMALAALPSCSSSRLQAKVFWGWKGKLNSVLAAMAPARLMGRLGKLAPK